MTSSLTKINVPLHNFITVNEIMKLMIMSYVNSSLEIKTPSFMNDFYVSRRRDGTIDVTVVDKNRKDVYVVIKEPQESIVSITYYDADENGKARKETVEISSTTEHDDLFSDLQKFIQKYD